jgi:predicted metalloprotease with PDZ domain
LSGNDALIAIGGLRATGANLDGLLERYQPGDRVELVAFRRDEMLRFEATLDAPAPLTWKLKPVAKAAAAALKLRRGWLR